MEDYKNDIIATRKGGLGSSDAKMVSKVGKTGKLSYSDRERIAVMLGQIEPTNFTTAATENGDYIENKLFSALKLSYPNAVSNPYYKSTYLTQNFGVDIFCHIDFEVIDEDERVVNWYECKASRYSTNQVREEYDEQLRWEYMLLNEKARDMGYKCNLMLVHYKVEELGVFNAENTTVLPVNFREGYADYLLKGLQLIKDTIFGGFEFEKRADIAADDLPTVMVSAMALAKQKLREAQELTAEVDAFKEKALEYCLAHGIKSIKGDDFSVIVKDEYTSSRIDSKMLLSKHPDVYSECLKTVNNKPSITIKVKQ